VDIEDHSRKAIPMSYHAVTRRTSRVCAGVMVAFVDSACRTDHPYAGVAVAFLATTNGRTSLPREA